MAYACSGFAALVYQISWTRLLALHLGQTTAAAATVVAAFMGGMAFGAYAAGRLAPRLTPRATLVGYALLEGVVIVTALGLPSVLSALQPLLAWAYGDVPGPPFSWLRVAVCFLLLTPPSVALGATFPLAARWFVVKNGDAGRLYAVNTAGAAVGAIAAGFLLLPSVGMLRTTAAGAAAGFLSIAAALLLASRTVGPRLRSGQGLGTGAAVGPTGHTSARAADRLGRPGIALIVLGLTGFATFVHEIAWTRMFAMILGPSTYAFSATVAVFVTGLAGGSLLGSALAARTRRPAVLACIALGAAAMAASVATSFAGTTLPWQVAQHFARSGAAYGDQLVSQFAWVAVLAGPAAFCLGAAFPLTLELASSEPRSSASRLGLLYAVNTAAGVAGSLMAGFLLVPWWGLEVTLVAGTAALAIAAIVLLPATGFRLAARFGCALPVAAAAAVMLFADPWDRKLLASGAYKYAGQIGEAELYTGLTAGSLLYYKEGPSATVAVKRLGGTTSLGIDGKVDASTASDMVTQKLLAHLPLLLHEAPRRVGIIGLGSGVTVGAALRHPVSAVDVIELSPEVVEASRFFEDENRQALDDPRTRLITGDGRSHMFLSSARYDVIVSEPSNPWMAGVAALYTQEFFQAARDRLAPGGIFCQWAHSYDISEVDLRSIAATFNTVFPAAAMWLVGDGDLLLVGAVDGLEPRIAQIERSWARPGVADDLRSVSAVEPFALLSSYAGGPSELAAFAGEEALQTDDRLALEFSGPWALNRANPRSNAATLRRMLDEAKAPAVIEHALASAGAAAWRNRGSMMMRAGAHSAAFEDFARAATLSPADREAVDGVVRAALAANRVDEAGALLRSAASALPDRPGPLVALSRLLAGIGEVEGALEAAAAALTVDAASVDALEQLASLHADLGDIQSLDPIVVDLLVRFPASPAAAYYAATSHFMHGDLERAANLAGRAIALNASSAAAHNLLGAIHASAGRSEQAARAFATALVLDPTDAAIYVNLGRLAISRGDALSAHERFSEALILDPRSTAAREGIAQTALAGR